MNLTELVRVIESRRYDSLQTIDSLDPEDSYEALPRKFWKGVEAAYEEVLLLLVELDSLE